MVNHPSRLSANTARAVARISVISAARGLLRGVDSMPGPALFLRHEADDLRSALIALDALLATEKP